MKKLVLCLAILSLLAVPAMAYEATDGIDVQGYGDMTASYQAGCVDQDTSFHGWQDVCDVNVASKITRFDCHAQVPSCFTTCGLNLTQNKCEFSATTTSQHGCFSENVDGTYAVGSNAMTNAGGLALCGSAGFCSGVTADGNLTQTQGLTQTATAGSFCFSPCYATGTYNADQSLTLNVNKGF